MILSRLRLENLRCLSRTELVLHRGANLVIGANGSGKTSLLEAAYLLGRGRSFRTRYLAQLLQYGTDRLWVAGEVGLEEPDRLVRRLDVQFERNRSIVARIDSQPVHSLAELAEVFPIQVVDPGIHRLVEEGPARRRRWLDWAVFHVEPRFLDSWLHYGRALRQRHGALEQGSDPAPWEIEMVRYGEVLSAVRARVMAALQPHWTETLQRLDAPPASLRFERGWSENETLEGSLSRHRHRDREQRRTSRGPHRFDVRLEVDGRPARDVVSRGQQKLLGAAMTVVLMRYVAETAGRVPTLLLDDPAAELDEAHARALLQVARQLDAQQIITALDPSNLPTLAPDRVFHVERGMVKTV